MRSAVTDSPLVIIQHVAVEGPGLIGQLLSERDIPTLHVGPDADMPSSDRLDRASGVIVLGGPMGVYEADRHPRLRGEIALLEHALAASKPVLGICLGAQLLAATLGARVYPGPRKELGWFDVTLTSAAGEDPLFREAPARFEALHWHGDVFDLPAGARHLASSELTAHQAFSAGDCAWGLLFHLEAGVDQVTAMAAAFPEEIAAAGTSAEALLAGARAFAGSAGDLGRRVFGAWLSLVEDRLRNR
jgi:GMP synthase (glutamine-hydrolysing)